MCALSFGESKALGTTPEFWLNLEKTYQLKTFNEASLPQVLAQLRRLEDHLVGRIEGEHGLILFRGRGAALRSALVIVYQEIQEHGRQERRLPVLTALHDQDLGEAPDPVVIDEAKGGQQLRLPLPRVE